MKKRLGAVLMACMLCACTATLTHYQLSVFNRGMSPPTVADKVQQPPLAQVPVTVDGRSFEFHRYQLDNGMGRDVYYLAYERNGLIFWGYVSEFRRHPDATLGRALELVLVDPRNVDKR